MNTISLLIPIILVGLIVVSGVSISWIFSNNKAGVPPDPLDFSVRVLVSGLSFLGIYGFFLCFFPNRIFAILLLFVTSTPLFFFKTFRHFTVQAAKLLRNSWPAFLAWTILSVNALFLTFVEPKKPLEFFDGPYVFKFWSLPVKIQTLSLDFPPDNAIPAVVGEFFARGISFEEVRPVMPGQEISNRPILMSLIYLPFRILFGTQTKDRYVPVMQYVGSNWPNTLSIISDYDFRIFLAVAIVINSLVAFAGLLIIQSLIVDRFKKYSLLTSVLLFSTNPFLIFHSLFTWPKSASAAFILFGLYFLLIRRSTPLLGLCMGLSFLFHPLALPFVVVVAAYLAINWLTARKSGPNSRHKSIIDLPRYVLIYCLVVLPWFIWTKLYLKIDTDLIQQSLARNQSLFDHIWVRLSNLINATIPSVFASPVFPGARTFIWTWLTSLTGFLSVMILLIKGKIEHQNLRSLLGITFSGGLLNTLIFSLGSPVLIHGWTPFLISLLASIIYRELRNGKVLRLLILSLSAIFINSGFVVIWITAVT